MRSQWIRVDPNATIGVLIRREKSAHKNRDTQGERHVAMRQRLKWCIYKPRSIKDGWQPPEAGKEAGNKPSLKASRKNPARTLISDF